MNVTRVERRINKVLNELVDEHKNEALLEMVLIKNDVYEISNIGWFLDKQKILGYNSADILVEIATDGSDIWRPVVKLMNRYTKSYTHVQIYFPNREYILKKHMLELEKMKIKMKERKMEKLMKYLEAGKLYIAKGNGVYIKLES